jgi:hypothetical protein
VTPPHACVRFATLVPGIAGVALNTSDPARVPGLVQLALNEVPRALWRDLIDAGLIDGQLGFLA